MLRPELPPRALRFPGSLPASTAPSSIPAHARPRRHPPPTLPGPLRPAGSSHASDAHPEPAAGPDAGERGVSAAGWSRVFDVVMLVGFLFMFVSLRVPVGGSTRAVLGQD